MPRGPICASQRSSRFGSTLLTVGRNVLSEEPSFILMVMRDPGRSSPDALRMNGFQDGNPLKSVSCCHIRSGGASMSSADASLFILPEPVRQPLCEAEPAPD